MKKTLEELERELDQLKAEIESLKPTGPLAEFQAILKEVIPPDIYSEYYEKQGKHIVSGNKYLYVYLPPANRKWFFGVMEAVRLFCQSDDYFPVCYKDQDPRYLKIRIA